MQANEAVIGRWVECNFRKNIEKGFIVGFEKQTLRTLAKVAVPRLKKTIPFRIEALTDIEEVTLKPQDFDEMINMAIDMNDRQWFNELSFAKNALLNK
ncbi:hypothetical protein [Halobacillus ihumii]|uniref:hypothetical protein n=1 Tax=Halobacillus ihumii TaxID=2686092 RepID=UPI0013D449A8|nr:hypothetical protein [Halobacillus ihumii]